MDAIMELALAAGLSEEEATEVLEAPVDYSTPNDSWEEAYVPTFLSPDEVREMERSNSFPLGFKPPTESRERFNGTWTTPKPMSLRRLDLLIMDWWDGNNTTERYAKIKGTQEGQFYQVWDRAHELNWAKPFGEVKRLKHLPRTEIYNRFCRTMEKAPKNGAPTALELFLDRFSKLYRLNFGTFVSQEEAMMLLSYRLWASTGGITGEEKVHEALYEWARQSPDRVYKEAPSRLENYGVDGLISEKLKDGTIRKQYVSIKAAKSLDPSFLYKERQAKPHRQKVDIYVGFKDGQEELTWLTVEDVIEQGAPKVNTHPRKQMRL